MQLIAYRYVTCERLWRQSAVYVALLHVTCMCPLYVSMCLDVSCDVMLHVAVACVYVSESGGVLSRAVTS